MDISALRNRMNEYFVGKEQVVEDTLICLLAGGHVLLEDVPGVGKTTLARTLAKAVECSFGRLQFTPDTLPSDVVGLSVYNMSTGGFEYREGAIQHQIILADEINRTSPKTQSSLLEAMEERQVTVDGKVYPLPRPFLVMATQNPVEFLGTFPLPEAELDRFMMRLSIGYPGKEQEIAMAKNYLKGMRPETMDRVCTADEVIALQDEVRQVKVGDKVLTYIRDIIDGTRKESRFVLGASPRALLHLVSTSQAKAYLSGRSYVIPDDVKAVALNTLHHRLQLTGEAKLQKADTDFILRELLQKINVPVD